MHSDANSSEMQDIGIKSSQNSSLYSTSTCEFDPTCWNSSSAITPQSSCSKNLNMNMDFLAKDGNQVKQLSHPISDHDSSTQSTGQSHQEASGMSEDNVHEQHISVNSGVGNTYENLVDGHMKPILSLETSETAFSLPKLDYSQSFAHVPYPCADPYFGGILALGRAHAMIHPQMVGIASSARVPLPLQPAAEEPIYVNTKQYNAILRRRQMRAKLEAQNKLIKARKPYLHESRHLHAMKRQEGSGGRFLNTKQLQQQKQTQTSAISGCQDHSGSKLCSGSGSIGSSAPSINSDIRTASMNGSMLTQQDHLSFPFPDFHSNVGVSTQGGHTMMGGVVQSFKS
ncbi:Nuclear transcription factor Y subunit [Musa troglodytarum]|uniref:Nuclear transcription factor Y subunit n=1 Tax=Musa troglodytarum TaxID=320322 RepID=A0A9E7EC11_9LILI|nr:Nuclear transcription factor Y subunit [Musa troglodytarum]URD74193.1 Nuclear transcription factor Y subunit [Musa troglodytarum]URD74194.1 Nuclear transcription factor Y subunit [Musa troglodytarum]URD74195.1 Nuclear transcription factor Y subunit [Musa troglodytarum]URD74196.1 Nuclear transcription factor Y subunit [Musa troglodytarum]